MSGQIARAAEGKEDLLKDFISCYEQSRKRIKEDRTKGLNIGFKKKRK